MTYPEAGGLREIMANPLISCSILISCFIILWAYDWSISRSNVFFLLHVPGVMFLSLLISLFFFKVLHKEVMFASLGLRERL